LVLIDKEVVLLFVLEVEEIRPNGHTHHLCFELEDKNDFLGSFLYVEIGTTFSKFTSLDLAEI